MFTRMKFESNNSLRRKIGCVEESSASDFARGMKSRESRETMNQTEFLREELAAAESGKPYAVATIVETSGSTSRERGKMLVYPDGQIVGTIGGGYVEKLVIEDARRCMETGEKLFKTYDMCTMAKEKGIICDGLFRVLIEPFGGNPMLVMVGGGHVGGALIRQAKLVGFPVMLIDSRPDADIEEKIALADTYIHVEDFAAEIPKLEIPRDSFYVIATWGHHFDGEALYGVLRHPSAYVGMIGNRQKIRFLFGKLRERGVTEEELARVHTPIGLDLGGETPEEIAVAIMAEILMVKYGRSGRSMSESQNKQK